MVNYWSRLLVVLALLCGGTPYGALAQSGRHKTQVPARPSQTSGQTPGTRPRTVNTGTPQRGQNSSTRTASSAERVPSDPSLLGEPPAFPTPKPTPAPAAAAPVDEIDARDVIRVNSTLVTVPASVLDASGRAVTNLKLEDFELRVDGQPRPISELGFADSPVRMAVLFDNSSSLTASREFEKQAAVRFFKSVLRPVDQAMIYSVSTVPTMEHPLTSDVQSLVRTIEHFPKPEGATALFDAIVQAATYLKPHQEGRRVIVIVSDGADTISDLDFETTLRRAQAADCQIYAVQTGQIENANLHDLAAERRLQEFTSQTGGAVYVPRGTNDLDAAFAQIAADLAQQYVLSYYPEDEQRDGRFRSISVRVTTRPNLRVRARKGYYAVPGQRQAWLPNVTTTPAPQVTNTQTQFIARSEVAAEGSGTSETGSGNGGPPGVLRAKTSASNTPRDRVGPRGPTDDAGGAGETKRGEPESNPTEQPPAAVSPERSSTPQPNSQPSSQPNSSPSPTPSPTPNSAPAPERKPEPPPESKPPASQQQQQPASRPAEAKQAPVVSGGALNGKAISLPKPVYPQMARTAGAYGSVIVEVTLDEQGKVIAARALSGHPMLQASCVAAARLARFSPTLISGRPVKVLGTITYNFARN